MQYSVGRREVLQPDSRGRVSLGRLGLDSEILIAEELESGRWVLTSAQVVSDVEAEILRNPRNVEELHQAISEADRGDTTPRRRAGRSGRTSQSAAAKAGDNASDRS